LPAPRFAGARVRMNLAEYVETEIWTRRGGAGRLGSLALRPLGVLFGAGLALRNLGYRSGLLRARRAEVPVVSVGNLSVGGAGKTPFTLWLSRALVRREIRTGIVLRGYGGRRRGVTVVSRGSGPVVGPGEAGDEAVMLAHRFPGPVVAGARRIEAVAAAVSLGCDAIVLDDGFQHRAIARNFDVVLLGEHCGPLLPAGPMRERWTALRRADAVVVVAPHPHRELRGALASIADKPRFHMRVVPTTLVETVGSRWQERPLGLLAGRRAVVVAGIARPERFYKLVHEWGAEIADVFRFPDHHHYRRDDWRRIVRAGRKADLVVTTEKDLVKLGSFPFASGQLLALRIEPEIEEEEGLVQMVVQGISRGERPEAAKRVAGRPVHDGEPGAERGA